MLYAREDHYKLLARQSDHLIDGKSTLHFECSGAEEARTSPKTQTHSSRRQVSSILLAIVLLASNLLATLILSRNKSANWNAVHASDVIRHRTLKTQIKRVKRKVSLQVAGSVSHVELESLHYLIQRALSNDSLKPAIKFKRKYLDKGLRG